MPMEMASTGLLGGGESVEGGDIAERKRAERDIQLLLQISQRLSSTLEINSLLDSLVNEALQLIGAESGCAGLRTPEGMACQKYFRGTEALPLNYCWPAGHGLPGWLIQHKVPYLTNDALNDDQIVHALCEQLGVWSALSTPILDADGEAIGFFEIHNKQDGTGFTRHDQQMLLMVSNIASVAIQNAKIYEATRNAEQALRRGEAWLAGQKEAFQAAMNGAPLEISLGVLIRTAIGQADSERRCAFYIASADGTELHHVAGMPESYARCVDGFKIGPESLSCGLAVATGQPVITPDVELEPRWQPWLWLAKGHDFRGCWSFPIETATGKVVGTFAMYFKDPRDATPRDRELASALTHTASIIISRHQESEERARVNRELVQSQRDLAAELAAAQQLQSISTELTAGPDVQALYEKVLDAAVAIMRADFASLQMLYPGRGKAGELRLLGFRGFDPEAAKFWEWVRADSGCTCGQAMRTGRRAVASNVETCDFMAGTEDRAAYLQAGMLAAQSTPLFSRSGRLLGMISTHWRKPYHPPESEMRRFDVLARQATDLIERAEAEAALRESERRYRGLVSATSQVLYRHNPAWSEMRQLRGGGFLADTDSPDPNWFDRYIHRDDQPHVRAAIQEAIRTKSVFELEHRVLRADGTLGWTHSRSTPVFGDNGDIIEWFGAASDVTARREAEQALRRSEERYRAFVTASSDVVFRMSADWREMLHLDGKDFIASTLEPSMTWLDKYIHPGDQPRVVAAIQEAIRAKSKFELEHRVLRADGSLGWTYSRAVPLLDADGQLVEWFGTASDVTERKQAEEALLESEERLYRLNRDLESRVRDEVAAREAAQAQLAHTQRMEALGQLAGGIAHDFNNVIQAVQGGASLIERRSGDAERVRGLARRIMEASERGGAITRRLLAFARGADLRAEPVDSVSLLAEMGEILSHTLGAGVAVRVQTGPNLPPMLVDKAQLETVLVNLAANARDAMQGMGTLTFAAAAEVVRNSDAVPRPVVLKPGAYVRLSISDTGCGMTPEVLARASEPFFTTKGVGQGTGLGLAMAHGFAQQSGGDLAIDSTLGLGTVIRLWFPVAEGTTIAIASRDNEASLAVFGDARGRLLLVDDDEFVREALAQEMEAEGYAVLPAASGAEALSLLDAGESVDLIISDMSMPGMDGVSLIGAAQQRRPRLPAILLTGFTATAGTALEAAVSGALTLLRKPVQGRELAERIATLLEGAAVAGVRKR